jgi:hypothetical protein
MLTPTDVMSCLAQVQRQMMDIPLERTVNVQSLYADVAPLWHIIQNLKNYIALLLLIDSMWQIYFFL